MKTNQPYKNHLKAINKSSIEPLVKTTATFNVKDTIPQILSRLDDKRTEVFTVDKGSCYFISNRIILDKKKINQSMKAEPKLQSIPCLEKKDKVKKAIKIFLQHKVNAIPVVKNKTILGEVRILSILEKMREWGLLKVTASQLERRDIRVSARQSISAARKKLKEEQLDALPVENEEGEITQIITTNDIVSILNPAQRVGTLGTIGKTKIRSLEPKISNIGTKRFPTCTPDDSIEFVVKSMVKGGFRCCVINLSPARQSFVTAHDIISIISTDKKKKIPIQFVGNKDNKRIVQSLSMLESPLEKFSKSVENILEARITTETQKTTGLETKYEMKLLLITPKNQLSFSTKTWTVEEGFSNFADMVLAKVSSKNKKIKKSIRKTSKLEILSKTKH